MLAGSVEQRAVVRLRQADFRDEAPDALLHVGHGYRGRAPARQRSLQRIALAGRESDQQDAGAGELAAAHARPLGLLLEVHLEPERAAQPHRALEADLAAHQPHQLLGDSGAQAGAAETARSRLVRLGKAFENPGLRLGRDADAGVADGELEPHAGFGLALR